MANALALSRIWYVASLVYMPTWVLRELNSLLFTFFWSGKKDKVNRKVVVQPKDRGGFGVVYIELKDQALLVQWFRRFVKSPNSWVSLLLFWCFDRFGVEPSDVISSFSAFVVSRLPRFYESCFRVWCAVGGSCGPSQTLSISGSGDVRVSVSSVCCKSTYLRLLEHAVVVPHCVSKFRSSFGDFYWPSTWSQLFYMPLDRGVIDLSWKVCHGALFTEDCLISFGYDHPPACFCGHPQETAEHLFIHCPLAKIGVDWVQSLLFRVVPAAPSILLRHVLFAFAPAELAAVPHVFVYLLHVLKFLVWNQRNDFRFRAVNPSAVTLLAGLKARLSFYLPLFFNRFRSIRRRRFFVRQWGGNGVICSLWGDGLVFHL